MSDLQAIPLVILSTFIATFGSYNLKKGALKFNLNLFDQLSNISLIIGVIFFLLSTVFYLIALKLSDLSMVFPLTSLSYIWVSIVSVKYFDEKINIYKAAGIMFIIIGAVLVTR